MSGRSGSSSSSGIDDAFNVNRTELLNDIRRQMPVPAAGAPTRILAVVLRTNIGNPSKHNNVVFMPVLVFSTDEERDAFIDSFDPSRVAGGMVAFEEFWIGKAHQLEDTLRDRQADHVRHILDDAETAVFERKRADQAEFAMALERTRRRNALASDPASIEPDSGNGEHDPQVVLQLRRHIAEEVVRNRLRQATDYSYTAPHREAAEFVEARRRRLELNPLLSNPSMSRDEIAQSVQAVESLTTIAPPRSVEITPK